MSGLNFKGKFAKPGLQVDVVLDVLSFLEDDIYFLYAPAFDLTGYGNNETEAKKSFELSIEEFLRYTMNKGTFSSELKRLGWSVRGSKKNTKYQPPFLDKLFQERDYLSEIVREKNFTKFNQEVAIPAMA